MLQVRRPVVPTTLRWVSSRQGQVRGFFSSGDWLLGYVSLSAMALLMQASNHKWAESVWCMSRMGMGMGVEFVYVCFSLDSATNEHLYRPAPDRSSSLLAYLVYMRQVPVFWILHASPQLSAATGLEQGPEMRMVNGTALCNFLPRGFFSFSLSSFVSRWAFLSSCHFSICLYATLAWN